MPNTPPLVAGHDGSRRPLSDRKVDDGLWCTDVEMGTPAALAGVEAGMRLVGFQGKELPLWGLKWKDVRPMLHRPLTRLICPPPSLPTVWAVTSLHTKRRCRSKSSRRRSQSRGATHFKGLQPPARPQVTRPTFSLPQVAVLFPGQCSYLTPLWHRCERSTRCNTPRSPGVASFKSTRGVPGPGPGTGGGQRQRRRDLRR